jgi:hypothetical protein
MDEEDQTPMPQPKLQGVLGTLWLVAKKTEEDLQSFPIDADRVTIGRYVQYYCCHGSMLTR